MAEKILVVDDNAMNLKMAQMILKQKGYEIELADSGKACLDFLNENEVDLVLLDVEMPEMSGMEVLKEIRETEKLKDISVVFITADVDDKTKSAAEELGALDYIKKPFMPMELQERVAKALGA